jgi:uncharacterized protein YjcR
MTTLDNERFTLTYDNRTKAKFLYWMGWRVSSISEYLQENEKTVHSWKQRDEWDKDAPAGIAAQALEARLCTLYLLDKKTPGDFKEIDLLERQKDRYTRREKYLTEDGNEADINPRIQNRNAKPKKQVKRNVITQAMIEKVQSDFDDGLFEYQRNWYRAKNQRSRNILKSRQIGATYYFAREAFVDAITGGGNQIFLSASKAQAHVFKSYIKSFAAESIDMDLSGDPITLNFDEGPSAELIFLGTNAKTAQGFHGNFYFDEYFWVHGFLELQKVASGMAMHKHWRKTYFSTPSSKSHQAYNFWTGEIFNKGKPKDKRLNIDVSHTALKDGRLCEDKIWRQIVTILDAEAGGCDLFDIEELRFEYSAESFANLLMCMFMDDGHSVFPLATMQQCMVDSWVLWERDFKPLALRPFGYQEVWVGYDPAESGDTAGLVVIAPPSMNYPKFRLLERHQFKGMDFKAQAAYIKKVCENYRVTYIGLDTTGMGTGVAQLVRQFFPALTTFNYSVEIKTMLVLKAMDVIGNSRFEFDAGWTDVSASFMAIKKTMTGSGRQFTFEATRSEETGHSDLAWACMHVFVNEPLEGRTNQNSSFMEIT